MKKHIRLYLSYTNPKTYLLGRRLQSLLFKFGLFVFVPTGSQRVLEQVIQENDALVILADLADRTGIPKRVRAEVKRATELNIPIQVWYDSTEDINLSAASLLEVSNKTLLHCPKYLQELMFTIRQLSLWIKKTESVCKETCNHDGKAAAAGERDE